MSCPVALLNAAEILYWPVIPQDSFYKIISCENEELKYHRLLFNSIIFGHHYDDHVNTYKLGILANGDKCLIIHTLMQYA